MKKIGEILRSEREKRSLSLHEIGMSLKINPKILKAIEDGDEKNLPAKTFLRGFIRSYAQYLRLDVEEILRLFQEEVGSTRPAEPKGEEISGSIATDIPISTEAGPAKATKEKPLRKPADENLNPTSSNRIFTIVGAIVLVLLIAFVAKMVEKYQKEIVRNDIPEVTTTTLPAPTSGNSMTPDVTAVAGSAPINSVPMTPAPIIATSTTLSRVTVTSTSTSTTLRTTTTTTMKAVVAKAPPTSTIPPTTTSTSSTSTSTVKSTTTTSPNKSVEVIVEALNKTTIKYRFGNGSVETLEMSADQVHTFKGKERISLEISDGGAVSIIVNGRDRGVPGTIGQPIKLSYP